MIWKIVTIACMLSHPDDCWTTVWPRPYGSWEECRSILDRPWAHPYDTPVKVEGSRWVWQGCRPEAGK